MAVVSIEFSEEKAWIDRLTDDFRTLLAGSRSTDRPFHVALSGGSTPTPLYRHWATQEFPWERIDWWIGDERWVPLTDPRSNEAMIRGSLGIGLGGRLRLRSWHRAEDPEDAANLYDKALREELGSPPVFDLILLGIGEDGHTASLFPGSPALDERAAYAVPNPAPGGGPLRLTLTYPCLNAARSVWFLVAGRAKKEIVQRVLSSDKALPAARIEAADQRLYWVGGR
ncbi:6-phosphogluconolactonase [Methylacidimicrobium cyclopophantes]|uniref:6-phosphogluconolactonase n=1 Tax=Methylacidimicrobium cyclopophantes TaxID=1041766 RepID=A0A5E6MK58_9BACT|nr:6-phosphogluconolactonase [Methylacidimicrobium cyclopophantes]VVM08475.1 6-phosphogluconolactonase [Methylacidimicrobium cyclopophantes]